MENEIKHLFKNSKNSSSKWEKYFEIYENVFKNYKNRDITFVEIGVHNGGSLEIWRNSLKIARPNTTRPISPLAAAVIASALSRLITKSAMMIVRIAVRRLLLWLIWPSRSCVSTSVSNFTPIQISKMPPISRSPGISIKLVAKNTKITRRIIAPAVPHRMPVSR